MARSNLDDFVLRDKIGSGSYGTVSKVIRKVDRQTYALKEIELQGMTRKARMRLLLSTTCTSGCLKACLAAQEQEECIRETQVLSCLDSKYIIKYYDSFLEKVW
jgi:NIMA (never in mitosis gene a)-related kinase